MVDDINHSMLATVGNFIAPIFTPLGFGNWQSTVATIMGLVAKEEVVGVFGVLYGVAGDALELVEAGSFAELAPLPCISPRCPLSPSCCLTSSALLALLLWAR